ncbi:uncharacterized protein ACLA_019450 [Aspergillus clavatus NRRL 1]|uniref:Uncharacterized protein n=1 Tax=Aspergillus clavatus (strain ATCC 1007 / CBS 513.65 / DSM 816 / NCTC 3887 / NRRL 1 / QM 1276 / 107) TaxID=344612 RepID=A1CNL9_ASPCL|nr:uncharacterized protein ACLA_019450 [Aspergillus clavatus NRRL 1]EAW07240.1 hypothetical protein ACLA_019450 [Aspergillus clavatus NRRL 1]
MERGGPNGKSEILSGQQQANAENGWVDVIGHEGIGNLRRCFVLGSHHIVKSDYQTDT